MRQVLAPIMAPTVTPIESRLDYGDDLGQELLAWFGPAPLRLMKNGRDIKAALGRAIMAIDKAVAGQMAKLLHNPILQQLEAAWHGLFYLLGQASNKQQIIIRILNVTWTEIDKDLARAADFDQSNLFSLIYNDEFGMPGGLPFGLILIDHQFCHKQTTQNRVDDIATLGLLSAIAAAAFVPIIMAVAPQFFGLDSFFELGERLNYRELLKGDEYQRFRNLQDMEDSRFLGLVLPNILIRAPPQYNIKSCVAGYRPPITSRDYLWASGIFAFAAVVIRSFHHHGWFATIRGVAEQAGGTVTDLPQAGFAIDCSPSKYRQPVQVQISNAQEKILSQLGFIPVNALKLTKNIVFMGNQSIYQPPHKVKQSGNTDYLMSSMLQYIMCVSRFSHYLKVIARDQIGSNTTAEGLENILSNWIQNYTTANDDGGQRARFPLKSARIKVEEKLGRLGTYGCTIYLQPHYQFDDVTADFIIKTELSNYK